MKDTRLEKASEMLNKHLNVVEGERQGNEVVLIAFVLHGTVGVAWLRPVISIFLFLPFPLWWNMFGIQSNLCNFSVKDFGISLKSAIFFTSCLSLDNCEWRKNLQNHLKVLMDRNLRSLWCISSLSSLQLLTNRHFTWTTFVYLMRHFFRNFHQSSFYLTPPRSFTSIMKIIETVGLGAINKLRYCILRGGWCRRRSRLKHLKTT